MVRWVKQIFPPIIDGSVGQNLKTFHENIINPVLRNSVNIKSCKSSLWSIMWFFWMVKNIIQRFWNNFNRFRIICQIEIAGQSQWKIFRIQFFFIFSRISFAEFTLATSPTWSKCRFMAKNCLPVFFYFEKRISTNSVVSCVPTFRRFFWRFA